MWLASRDKQFMQRHLILNDATLLAFERFEICRGARETHPETDRGIVRLNSFSLHGRKFFRPCDALQKQKQSS